LSTIHLPIDVDTSDRSLGKKIAEARTKKYNHIIVVGGREVESGSMNLQIVNQPNEESTVEALQVSLGKKLTEKERSKATVNVDLDGARRYFENLANSFL
jgi:threonyl-tRNA synthetase